MGEQISYIDFGSRRGSCEIDEKPDTCPLCGVKTNPDLLTVYKQTTDYGGFEHIEALFKCTNKECRHTFIGYFARGYPSAFNDCQSHLCDHIWQHVYFPDQCIYRLGDETIQSKCVHRN